MIYQFLIQVGRRKLESGSSGLVGVSNGVSMARYDPAVSSSITTKPSAQDSITTEGGLLGGSSAYMTSLSHYTPSVLSLGGDASSVTGQTYSGVLSTTTTGRTSGGSSGGDFQPNEIFPAQGTFSEDYSTGVHVSAGQRPTSKNDASTGPKSASRLESLLERISSLDSSAAGMFSSHPSSVRPPSVRPPACIPVGTNFPVATGGHPVHALPITTCNFPPFVMPNPVPATMVTRQPRPGLETVSTGRSGREPHKGINNRLVPESLSQGMTGTANDGLMAGTENPQKYLSQ